jgi:2-aminoadipate transaminase
MQNSFSDRIAGVPRSFIREILKVARDESIISFAGGLPNRNLFPVQELHTSTNKLFNEAGKDILQYSDSEGYLELREWIAARYKDKKGIIINPHNILITAGSQQALDLLGKIFLNEGDSVILEKPGYLGAIQAFSVYKPNFIQIPLESEGINLSILQKTVENHAVKLFYCVPNFQNPSGITYSTENRSTVANILRSKQTILVEDDPYGELRFLGEDRPSFYKLFPERTVLLGSFSKTVVPSFRIGWIIANDDIMEKLVVAKQASDLHTNYFGQRVIYQYLKDNDIDQHIGKIRNAYGQQRLAMVKAIEEFFPPGITCTRPEGGMFLWITLPAGLSALTVFERAIRNKVAFVPGDPFYVAEKNVNTMRLNFSCADEDTIRKGIKRLGNILKDMIYI